MYSEGSVISLYDRAFFVVRHGSMTGPGSDYLYSVNSEEAYTLEISGMAAVSINESTGDLVGQSRVGMTGPITSYVFAYDEQRGEFYVVAAVEEYPY